ncbi:hypothetical protein EVA_10457 [gut metagenome]|uniref:Uncharacterized protein n=1 Tax=gut metagenome TaxID=749906 RepID=J9GNF6_9ZZZZ
MRLCSDFERCASFVEKIHPGQKSPLPFSDDFSFVRVWSSASHQHFTCNLRDCVCSSGHFYAKQKRR